MIKDITGMRFGKLIAIESTSKRLFRNVIWLCQCDCGNFKEVDQGSLKNGLVKSCGCIHRFADREKVYKKVIVSRLKESAIRKGRDFLISDELAFELSQDDCEYCNTPPSNCTVYKADGLGLFYNGIDRIDNSKGYILGNVVSCCKRCNAAKNDMPLDEFKTWINKVYETTIKDKKENI